MSEEVKSEKPSIFGMIMSPSEQLERVRERPLVLVPLIIVTVIFIIGTWLQMQGIEVPELEGLSAEEVAMANQFMTIGAVISAAFMPIIMILISTVIYMIVVKIARSDVRFKQMFSMTTYITFIAALGVVLNGIFFALFGGGEGVYYTSLGSLIPAEGALAGLLDSLEIFSIWTVILTAIGLHKVAKLSSKASWSISIAFFVITTLFAMFFAQIGSGMAGL